MSGTGSGLYQEHQGMPYLDFLGLLNEHLSPRTYFEIGTNTGSSIERFSCDAVCVDPKFLVERNVWTRRRTFLFQMTSDDFFRDENLHHYFPGGPELSFLDGMHLFEFLLRDFMNVERLSDPKSLILMHDCLPLSLRMAERKYFGGGDDEGDFQWAWTGDVWKILHAFRKFRPDLRVTYIDCPPTGLVAVSNLDPESAVFSREYERVIAEIGSLPLDMAGLAALRSMYPTVSSRTLAAAPGLLTSTFRCR
jgi:hypothetical protein